jgi:Domain of unknown function (DUF4145)
MTPTTAHCNRCSGDTNHDVLHSERSEWHDETYGISSVDAYDTLKCKGCNQIKLRHSSWYSENEETRVNYFPPAIFRQRPKWFQLLWMILHPDDVFVEKLLGEIYVALHNNMPHLATMGVRSLLERVMISKSGDQGTFSKNIAAFEQLGFVSRVERERLQTILEVGHATIHRSFSPTTNDVITLMDVTEHIIETIYVHDADVKALQRRVPPRQQPKP